jgi:hypothetical protein
VIFCWSFFSRFFFVVVCIKHHNYHAIKIYVVVFHSNFKDYFEADFNVDMFSFVQIIKINVSKTILVVVTQEQQK